mgnify:CR=1 FL=1
MNLLITGAWQSAYKNIVALEQLGHRVAFIQQEKEDLPCDAEWIEGVICNGLFLHHDIKEFKNLRYIQLTSAGFDRVPMNYVKEHDIEIHNARGVYSIPMAEFAIAGVLQIYKQNRYFYENQKEHKWEKHRGLLELLEKKVCIVGCGSVGTECAKRFKAFGCSVIGVDIKPYQNELYDSMLPLDSLDDALTKADVTILTLPLTEETCRFINTDRFKTMKNGAVLVNISRGAIIDTDALIAALNEHLGGAVLDVFDEEPLHENSPLWDMRNVIITPHNSFVSEGNYARLLDVIMNNLERAEK